MLMFDRHIPPFFVAKKQPIVFARLSYVYTCMSLLFKQDTERSGCKRENSCFMTLNQLLNIVWNLKYIYMSK